MSLNWVTVVPFSMSHNTFTNEAPVNLCPNSAAIQLINSLQYEYAAIGSVATVGVKNKKILAATKPAPSAKIPAKPGRQLSRKPLTR